MDKARIRLIHPTRIGNKPQAAGAEVPCDRTRALSLVAQGRAEMLSDPGGDRMVRDLDRGAPAPIAPQADGEVSGE